MLAIENKRNSSANLLFLITALFWFGQYTYVPYVNPSLAALGAGAVFMGFVSGAYGLTQMILRIPLGLWTEKIGKKRCIIAGCLLCAASSFCMLSINHPAAFLIGRGLAGVASATWIGFTILYSSYFRDEESVSAITMLNVSSQIGQVAAFAAGGAAVAYLGVRSAFVIAGAVGLAAFALAFFIRDSSAAKSAVSLREFWGVIHNRNLLLCCLYAAVAQMIAFSTFQTFITNHAMEIGVKTGQMSYMYLFVLGPGIIAGYAVSKFLVRKFSIRVIGFTGFLLLAAYCAAVPITGSAAQIFMISVLAGVGYSLTYNLMMGLCVRDIAADKRSAAMGFFQAAYGIGMTLGPIFMGWVTGAFSLNTGFYIMAAIAAVAAVGALVNMRKK